MTSPINSSRRWWSSTIQRDHERIRGKIRWRFAMAKRRRTKEKVSVLLEPITLPNTSCISEQSRDIQEVLSLILHCKTIYYYQMVSPSTSTARECEWNLFKNSRWIDPRRRSLKPDRQSVFLTIVDPMDDDQSMEEQQCVLNKASIVPYWNTWKPHQNTVYWCNLKLAQEKGLQFHQTRWHAIVLYNTLPAICIETAVCMKTGHERYHIVYHSPRIPRITLRPNSQSGLKDPRDQDARESFHHQSESELSYGETRWGDIDFMIPGILLSVVQQQDTNRPETVKKLIQKFESHPNKESFLQDLNTDWKGKCVQREVEEVDHRHG